MTSLRWTVLGCVAVGAVASCSGTPAEVAPTTPPAAESSAPARLGPGGSVRITFPAAYALSSTAIGRIDAVACGGARGEWHGTTTLDDPFIDEKSKPVEWTFDSAGAAEVQAGPFDYGLSSGGHYVLFLVHLRLVAGSGSSSEIMVDRVCAVQPGFPPTPSVATTPAPPFPVTLGAVPGC